MRRTRIGAIAIGAGGAAAWLLACSTLPVVPIDRDEPDAPAEARVEAGGTDAASFEATSDAATDADAASDADGP